MFKTRDRATLLTLYKLLVRSLSKIPPLAKSSSAGNLTKIDHSFSVLGPKLWNCVPSNITVITDFDKFKTDLTDFLITVPRPDTSPVSGYTSANRNSLLHWFQSGIMLNGAEVRQLMTSRLLYELTEVINETLFTDKMARINTL